MRPKKTRWVKCEPEERCFRPKYKPLRKLKGVYLTLDEFEAIRLKDKLGFDQIEAAEKLNISQPTFHRILDSARKKIAEAIVDGKAIKIHGGEYNMPNRDGTGPEGKGPRTGRGMGNCPPKEGESLDKTRPRRRGLGPCGDGTPRGGGRGRGRRN